jgi:hypothetical protein
VLSAWATGPQVDGRPLLFRTMVIATLLDIGNDVAGCRAAERLWHIRSHVILLSSARETLGSREHAHELG